MYQHDLVQRAMVWQEYCEGDSCHQRDRDQQRWDDGKHLGYHLVNELKSDWIELHRMGA